MPACRKNERPSRCDWICSRCTAVHRDGAIVDIVSYTRSANSVGLISRCRCCSRAIDVSAIIDVRRRL